ncbi:MAG: molybdopterin-guanine dinucleotide biosynthesis protein B [Pseudomonadota bacterium]
MDKYPGNVFGVAGFKNTGKTTLIECLIAEFSKRKINVATLKHTHHDLDFSGSGTDSERHRRAGAAETIVCSPTETQHVKTYLKEQPNLQTLLRQLGAYDIALAEGWKQEPLQKLMVCDAVDAPPFPGTIAYVVATDTAKQASLPVFHRDNVTEIATFLLAKCAADQS